MPCSLSSCSSELNGLPEGSRWIRSQSASPSRRIARVSANSLETLWIENGTAAVAGRRLLAGAGAQGDAELRRRHPRQRRDVARDPAFPAELRPEVAIDAVEEGLEVHGREGDSALVTQPMMRHAAARPSSATITPIATRGAEGGREPAAGERADQRRQHGRSC